VAKRQQRARKRTRQSRRARRDEVDVKTFLVDHGDTADGGSPAARSGAATAASAPTDLGLFALLPGETGEALAQAVLLLSASSFRQYAGLVETLGRHAPGLVRALQAGGASEGESVERLRACLREIADSSIEEARRLRDQIDRLDHRAGAPPPAGEAPHWRRRWKAKS
jgi:hypothetical protein